jgi:hypothetical protein
MVERITDGMLAAFVILEPPVDLADEILNRYGHVADCIRPQNDSTDYSPR